MLIDVVRPEMWEDLNDRLKAHFLLLDSKVQIRAYFGLAQAVFELAQGTSHFMAHKKSIGAILGQTPAYEGILPYYYKEAYQVQTAEHDKLTDLKQWVENLNKDTLFVFMAEDHPVTGELYSFVDELDKLLNEKRIIVFRISHARHYFENTEVRPYTVRICSYNENHSIAFCGERFRSPSLATQGMMWNQDEFITQVDASRQGREQNESLVADFEKQVANIAAPWFKVGVPRLNDRAVCVLPDISAEAMLKTLAKNLSIPPEEASRFLGTTNLCQWDAVRMFSTWWKPEPTPDQLRGLVAISPSLLSIKDFAKHFVSAYEEVKQQQSWDL